MNQKTSSRKYAGQSESERIRERREKFLDAGLEIFGTVGLRGAKVRALCKEAGLTERYFYESFANVEALFIAVSEWQNSKIFEFFASELPQLPGDLEDRIRAALNLYFDLMRNERLARVRLVESMVGSEKIRERHIAEIRQFGKIAAQFIRIDNPGLAISDELLETMGMAINGAINTLVTQWMLEGYSTPQDTVVSGAVLAVKGMMTEIRAHQEP